MDGIRNVPWKQLPSIYNGLPNVVCQNYNLTMEKKPKSDQTSPRLGWWFWQPRKNLRCSASGIVHWNWSAWNAWDQTLMCDAEPLNTWVNAMERKRVQWCAGITKKLSPSGAANIPTRGRSRKNQLRFDDVLTSTQSHEMETHAICAGQLKVPHSMASHAINRAYIRIMNYITAPVWCI